MWVGLDYSDLEYPLNVTPQPRIATINDTRGSWAKKKQYPPTEGIENGSSYTQLRGNKSKMRDE